MKDLADNSWGQGDGDDIRPPLPVKREVLYDNAVLYGYAIPLLMLLNLLNCLYVSLLFMLFAHSISFSCFYWSWHGHFMC